MIIAYYFDDIFSIFIEPINSLTVVITSIIGKYLNLDVIQYPFAQKSLLHILPISINYYSVVLYDKTTKIVISNGTLTEDCILGFIFTNYLFFSFLYLYFKVFEAINLNNMKYFLIKYKLIIFKKIITGIILTFIFSLVRFLIILSSEWVIFSFTPFNSSSLIDIYIRFNIAHNVIANTILIPILLLFIIYLSYGLKSSNSSSIDLIR